MKKSDLKSVLNQFGYQFLDQLNNDLSKIVFEVMLKTKEDPRKKTNMSLDTFIHTIDEELESRDNKESGE